MNDVTQRLQAWAETAVPTVDVDTSTVVVRGRRRRATRRAATGLAVAAVVAGGVWGAQAVPPWTAASTLGPAGSAPVGTTGAIPTPSADGTPSVTDAPTDEETEGIPAGSWWYTRSASGDEVTETWQSREQPGLLMWDGDTTTASGIGPINSFGGFRIDGQWVDMVRDPALLPTDPDELRAVLYASVEPDRRTGTDDEKVAGMARDLLARGGLMGTELRHAVWEALAGVPGVRVTEGQDSLGRFAEVLEYTQDGSRATLVRDPETGLLLEEATYLGTEHSWTTTYLEQKVVDSVPVEPTLENAGCASWETC